MSLSPGPTTSLSSSSSSKSKSKDDKDEIEKPRFRGHWTPAIKNPEPHDHWGFGWTPQVREASSMLNTLTNTTKYKTPPASPSSQSLAKKPALDSSVLVEISTTTTNDDASANAGASASASSAASGPKSPDMYLPIKPKVSDASTASSISSNSSASSGDADLEASHTDNSPTRNPDEQKVEEANKTITKIAATLADYETSHGEVEAAAKRVKELMARYNGHLSEAEVVSHIVKSKCLQAALIGFIIGGCATVPGLGSLAAIILGAAADGALTTKLQVDMILEIGCALGHYEKLMDGKYRRNFMLAAAGLVKHDVDEAVPGSPDDPLTVEAGHRVTEKALEEFGKRALLRFIPVVGAVAAAGTNLTWTYVIGKRAHIIARDGEDSLPPWNESVKKHTGVDSTALSSWLIEAFELPRQRFVQKVKATSARIMTSIRKYTGGSSNNNNNASDASSSR